MVASAPNVLTISIQDSMAPKLGWLSRRLMLSNEQLAMVVTTCPQVVWLWRCNWFLRAGGSCLLVREEDSGVNGGSFCLDLFVSGK